MGATPRLPSKLSFADVVTLDLPGRRFNAREGMTHVRGVVSAVAVEGEMLRIDVTAVERRRADQTWEPGADFDYQGRGGDTSIFHEVDGAVSVAIPFIGTINILPGARA